ncbi:MAG TPA: hypothetical protein VGG03_21355 [Thermoanaerobaculia bacterium]|jgi:hypothetical protein
MDPKDRLSGSRGARSPWIVAIAAALLLAGTGPAAASGPAGAKASAGSLQAFGLPHTPEGQAELSFKEKEGLVVSNLGADGTDGVLIGLGETGFLQLGLGDLSGAPKGARIELEALGVQGRLGVGRVESSGDGWLLSAESLGPPSHRVSVFSGGRLVGSAELPAGQAVRSGAAPSGSQSGPIQNPGSGPGGTNCDPWETVEWYCVSYGGNSCGVSWNFPSGSLSSCCSAAGGSVVATCGIPSIVSYDFDLATAFAIEGLGQVEGDQVVFEVSDPNVLTGLRAVSVHAANLPSLQITDEAVESSFLAHSAVGNAALKPAAGSLTVAPAGRNDGVAIDAGRVQGWSGDVREGVDLRTAGAVFASELRGRVDGVDDRVIGASRIRGTGQEAVLTVDFSPVGSPASLVELFDAKGGLIASFEMPNGTPLTLLGGDAQAAAGGLKIQNQCPGGTFITVCSQQWLCESNGDSGWVTVCRQICVTGPSGQVYPNVSSIRVTGLGITAARNFVSSASVSGFRLGPINLSSETVQPIPTKALAVKPPGER